MNHCCSAIEMSIVWLSEMISPVQLPTNDARRWIKSKIKFGPSWLRWEGEIETQSYLCSLGVLVEDMDEVRVLESCMNELSADFSGTYEQFRSEDGEQVTMKIRFRDRGDAESFRDRMSQIAAGRGGYVHLKEIVVT